MHPRPFWYLLFIALLATGCSSLPSPQERIASAEALITTHHWVSQTKNFTHFQLLTAQPASLAQTKVSKLAVIIEGDGLAWISRSQVSANPTPIQPMGLKIALNHPTEQVVYLARPCQFSTEKCDARYWTGARFAQEVLDAYQAELNRFKEAYQVEVFELVGYSVGAQIALMLRGRAQGCAACHYTRRQS